MKTINVTQTYLPPFKKYEKYLKTIWKTKWLTNKGPYCQELEQKLTSYLEVPYLKLVSNGTLGLQLALRALVGDGTVITTPFSYIASSSSILWEGKKVVFADIDPQTLCIDPLKIREKLDKQTKAILAVHVYGNACDIESISAIANQHKLKVLYDAAHAFGVKYKDKSILSYGDASVLSFHATKVFHTIEGGAVATTSEITDEKVSYLRNFGHKGYEDFYGLGINAKMSEFNAAMGLCVLEDIQKIIQKRKFVHDTYDKLLFGAKISRPVFSQFVTRNYSYYPVIFVTESQLLSVVKKLNESQIYPRRYFYPSLNTLEFLSRSNCPIAEDISKRILCLPLYPSLKLDDIQRIVSVIYANI